MKAGDFEAVAKAGYKRAPRGKGLTLGNLGFIDEYFTFSDAIDWLLLDSSLTLPLCSGKLSFYCVRLI